jgi:polysaccharide deacetylase family protein (PEP-CTERM system associated)
VAPDTVANALTVDVEDWFHVCGLPETPTVPKGEWRVRENVARLLALLDDYGVKATFFVLGSVAEVLPEIVTEVAAAGHEVASHGFSHRLVSGLTPGEFREELRRTGEILASLAGKRPTGFRAPQWSLSQTATPWAFEILGEEGYCYDSSCTPLPLIGDPRAPRAPYRVATGAGSIWEIPPMVTVTPLCNLPTGGGWGFRFFPRSMIRATIRGLNRRGAPAVIYVHPRELDPRGPRVSLAPLKAFATYGPRRDVSGRIGDLLGRHRFTTLRDLVEQWESA